MYVKDFFDNMKTDQELAKEFLDFFKANGDDRIKALTKETAEKLDRIELDVLQAFAAEKGFTFEQNDEQCAAVASINKSMCEQMNKLVLDQMLKGAL